MNRQVTFTVDDVTYSAQVRKITVGRMRKYANMELAADNDIDSKAAVAIKILLDAVVSWTYPAQLSAETINEVFDLDELKTLNEAIMSSLPLSVMPNS